MNQIELSRSWKEKRMVSSVGAPLGRTDRILLISAVGAAFLGFFVKIEPAPYDAFLGLMLLLAGVSCRFSSRVPWNQLIIVSVLAFLVSNTVSFAVAYVSSLNGHGLKLEIYDLNSSVKFLALKWYYVGTWWIFSWFTVRYGAVGVSKVMMIYSIVAAVSSILVIVAMLKPGAFDGLGLVFAGRGRGFFKDPNVFGPFLVPAFVYNFSRVLTNARYVALSLGLAMICALGVLFSVSRAALVLNMWLGMIIAFAVLLAVGKANLLSRKRMLMTLGVVILGLGGFYFKSTQVSVFEARSSMQRYDEERFSNQRQGVEAGLVAPLGVGLGQAEKGLGLATHSIYVRMLYENGPLGLVIWIAMISVHLGFLYRAGSAIRTRIDACVYLLAMAGTVGIMFNGIVVDVLHWRHLWMLLGISNGLITRSQIGLSSSSE